LNTVQLISNDDRAIIYGPSYQIMVLDSDDKETWKDYTKVLHLPQPEKGKLLAAFIVVDTKDTTEYPASVIMLDTNNRKGKQLLEWINTTILHILMNVIPPRHPYLIKADKENVIRIIMVVWNRMLRVFGNYPKAMLISEDEQLVVSFTDIKYTVQYPLKKFV